MCSRIIRRNPDREQQYPSYEDFQTELRARFWKDTDAQIKHVQWEKFRQTNFPDADQFFQKFKELAYDAGIHGNEQVMLAQIKRATCETSKNTIYAGDREVPTTYDGWKAHLLHMDYITTISSGQKELQLGELTPDHRHRRQPCPRRVVKHQYIHWRRKWQQEQHMEDAAHQ